MTVSVRTATRADALAIARVRVDSWRVAYRGLLSAATLDALDADVEGRRRHERWSEYTADARSRQLVAVDQDAEVVGWAAVGPGRDDDRRGSGELYAIYALPSHWSRGVGTALLHAAEDALRAGGFSTAFLWVLEGNERAASFYERHGWLEDGAVKRDEGLFADPLHERRRVTVLSDGGR